MFDGAHDGDAPRDGRLEPHMPPGPPRNLEQFRPCMSDDLLVRGHDRLPRRKGAPDPLFRRQPSADELHEHVDVVRERVVDVLRPADGRVEPVHTLTLNIAIADDDHLQFRCPEIVQQPRDRAADRAKSGDGDAAGTSRHHAMFARAHAIPPDSRTIIFPRFGQDLRRFGPTRM
jgi:hypothetical protein